MKRLSSQYAAREGFRLMVREPLAFLVWTGLWLATFSVAASVVAASTPAGLAQARLATSAGNLTTRFGPFSFVVVLLFLLVWLVTALAAFRAVLRPEDRRWFFLRLGADELRLGILTLVAFFAAIGAGGAPATLVFILASPIMHALPTASRLIAEVGVAVTVWFEVWLGVRLSLIAVETFSERRFHLAAYWPVTRGRFWYLLGAYLLFFLMLLGLTVLFAPVIVILTPTDVTPSPGDLPRRALLLLQAGLLAGLISVFWTLSSTLLYACQARAFSAIAGEDGVPP
ncbi:MAG TPA: hypothetical protein VGN38_08275 [Caulobacteraceae bacterium]|jgi:hypothetical protein|nr:hypothetical protein [Caulobacteraceae bacterium]